MTHERQNVRRAAGYTPGDQPECRVVAKLNTNENPYPPARQVIEALQSVQPDELRRYPHPSARAFRELAASVHGLSPQNVIATNGGDELLRLAISTFVEPGQPIGIVRPSYGLYGVLAEIHDSPTFALPLQDDWSLPPDLGRKMNEAGVALLLICNPHAPSGTLISVPELDRLASEFNGVLLIDEAYVDFVDPALAHNTLPLLSRHENLLMLRTLSKGYSLAGLRFAYGLGAASLLEPMFKTKDSYNVDAIAQRLAVAALEAGDAARASAQRVRSERQRMAQSLAARALPSAPSQTNFLLVSVPEDSRGGARGVFEGLRTQGIFVRYFDEDRLRDKLRITIGTPAENDALLAALDMLGFGAAHP
ncbi:histidinol-phosphate transaminase [Microvirgula aerodenitrificans]|uniref:Histidinol-phosphate aminotransferase n=1 Tax=Microvirgula aerodenitrificans TaxID=57480 RepID=A0A2S0PE87_9NEIS|nr:histidinol-phosphate transaminase [Microvirgula aerodenitrificans]AVY95633.1 histidinol-phosphate transaminase [Microvirgula aerodenitrificans]